jgi:hypothetical protein
VIVVGRIRLLPAVVPVFEQPVPIPEAVVVEAVGGDVTEGMVGNTGLDPKSPKAGDTPGVGTAAAELTPRLPISVESSGIPVRATPPAVDAGVDDAAMPLEPEPHIPDDPEVSDDADGLPPVVPVADAGLPTVIPPPSKLAVEPNIPPGVVPNVEQDAPPPEIEIVPVGLPGWGLTPGDAISVAPKGIPVPPTELADVMPSGEVTAMPGIAVVVPSTCAMATLIAKSPGTTATISRHLIGHSPSGNRWITAGTYQSIGRIAFCFARKLTCEYSVRIRQRCFTLQVRTSCIPIKDCCDNERPRPLSKDTEP